MAAKPYACIARTATTRRTISALAFLPALSASARVSGMLVVPSQFSEDAPWHNKACKRDGENAGN
jgi:hypothetical protein